MEKLQPTRQQIIDDVRLWSKHFLEVPNLHLGGVPACPFAKKAWLDKKVWVTVKSKYTPYKKELNNCLKNLDFSVSEILIFCDPYFSYTPDELHIATEEYNDQHNKKDLFFMSFHPSNPATEEEQKFLVSPNKVLKSFETVREELRSVQMKLKETYGNVSINVEDGSLTEIEETDEQADKKD